MHNEHKNGEASSVQSARNTRNSPKCIDIFMNVWYALATMNNEPRRQRETYRLIDGTRRKGFCFIGHTRKEVNATNPRPYNGGYLYETANGKILRFPSLEVFYQYLDDQTDDDE